LPEVFLFFVLTLPTLIFFLFHRAIDIVALSSAAIAVIHDHVSV
jgi:hypothetical protein